MLGHEMHSIGIVTFYSRSIYIAMDRNKIALEALLMKYHWKKYRSVRQHYFIPSYDILLRVDVSTCRLGAGVSHQRT